MINKTEDKSKTEDNKAFYGILGFACTVSFITLTIYFSKFNGELSDDQNLWGVFGDYLAGTLNPVFSFLSLIAILITLRYQIRELSLSTEELKMSRDVMQEQSNSLKTQTFDNTFFNLIKLQSGIIEDIDIRNPKTGVVIRKGRDCFQYFLKQMAFRFEAIDDDNTLEYRRDMIGAAYEDHCKKFGADTNHYFKNLEVILDYLDRTEKFLKQDQIERYILILIAQLSRYEIILLFSHCVENSDSNLRLFVEKYSLLTEINPRDLPYPDVDLKLFKKSAYGNNPTVLTILN